MKKGKAFKFLNIIMVVSVFALSFYAGNILAGLGKDDKDPVKVSTEVDEKGLPVDRLNVLLMGIDARKGEKDTRTDSLILVSIDKETNKIAMLSIPRDTLVEIPGHGEDKINAANAIGGSELAVETVEELLDVEIPYYAKTNFEGFKDVVDTLGGVTIDVEKKMYYPDGRNTINLKKGVQQLDGNKALQYVRFRHDALGDISRTERQQKFLSALADELLQAKTIVKLPKLIPQLLSVVETNFGVKDAFFLTRVASSMKADNIVAQTLPGTFYNYKGISYWKANEEKTKLVLAEMFSGVTTAAVIDKPINVPKTSKPKPVAPVPQQPKPEVPVDVDIDGSIPPEDQEQQPPDPNNPVEQPQDPTGGTTPGTNTPGTNTPGTNTPGTTLPGTNPPTGTNPATPSTPNSGQTAPGGTVPGNNTGQTTKPNTGAGSASSTQVNPAIVVPPA